MGGDVLNLYKPTQDGAEIVSALATGTIALLVIGVQPILLGGNGGGAQRHAGGWGMIAMSEIVALGLGVVLCDALLQISIHRVMHFVRHDLGALGGCHGRAHEMGDRQDLRGGHRRQRVLR